MQPQDIHSASTPINVAVGRFLRQSRGRRGLTRRELSRRSDISERYLGEVEKGRANITLAVLQRIADVLGEKVTSFLPHETAATRIAAPLETLIAAMSGKEQAALYRKLLRDSRPDTQRIHGIALIGVRGAGKSTLGLHLAKATGVPFVRLTETIEDIAGMALGEILELVGENAYRRFERQALERIRSAYPLCVVEAGGSLVRDEETFKQLLRSYRTIWLKAEPQDHMQRVIDQGDLRPMAGNDQAMAELRLILREREAYYAQADHMLETSGRSVEDCLADLKALSRDVLRIR